MTKREFGDAVGLFFACLACLLIGIVVACFLLEYGEKTTPKKSQPSNTVNVDIPAEKAGVSFSAEEKEVKKANTNQEGKTNGYAVKTMVGEIKFK